MGYDYKTERASLFTEDGQAVFMAIYDNSRKLLETAGAFRAQESWKGCSDSSWTMLACLDLLVERGKIREVTDPAKVFAQHRVFVSAARDD